MVNKIIAQHLLDSSEFSWWCDGAATLSVLFDLVGWSYDELELFHFLLLHTVKIRRCAISRAESFMYRPSPCTV